MDDQNLEKQRKRARIAAIRLLAPEEALRKKPKSKKRSATETMAIIKRNFPFPDKQSKLLKALITRGSLDTYTLQNITESKDIKALVRDTRKKIKSYEHLRNIIDIGSFRKGKKWLYRLKTF